MKSFTSRLFRKTPAEAFFSFLGTYALLLTTLFTVELIVMLVLPYLPLGGYPFLEDFIDALMLTTLSAPFLWKLIVGPLRRMAMMQKTRAETILGHIAEGVVCFDGNGVIESFNPPAEEIFGYSAGEIKNRDIMVLFSKEESREQGLSIQDLIPSKGEDKGRNIQDLVGLKKNGGRYDMDLSVSEVSLGGRTMHIGIIRDTAERNRSRRDSGLAAKVFENVGEAIGITDADNSYVSVNPAFTRITGYTEDEVIGRNPRLMASGLHDTAFYQRMWGAIHQDASWQGEIWDRRKDGNVYPKWLSISVVKDKRGRVRNHIAVFSDISERKAAEERIKYMAHYDALTCLPNRILLQDRIEHAIRFVQRSGNGTAVLFLDLDRFKAINDTLGHCTGDLLLQSVGERLKECIRRSDTVGRLGGDEFIVVLSDIESTDYVASVAQRILATISQPIVIKGNELNTSASIGISVYPSDGDNYESLIGNADVAMYRSKGRGPNNYQFFTPDMNARALERLSMENNLHRALERQEFLLYYQPQVDSTEKRIIGAEALIRWQHPEKGLVPPGEFIPIAEESGLITAIGEWVIREACRQNKTWQEESLSIVPVAVNLSAVQFRQKNLRELVADALRQTALEPRFLELEITENSVIQDAEGAIDVLQSLKQMGIVISMDDFGTGYSSLSYLKRFPIDKLKIDRSFVKDVTTDPDDAAIVSAIISMAKSLKLRAIAEGVETKSQLDFLCSCGCTEIQGYYYFKPLPPHQFKELLLPGRG